MVYLASIMLVHVKNTSENVLKCFSFFGGEKYFLEICLNIQNLIGKYNFTIYFRCAMKAFAKLSLSVKKRKKLPQHGFVL